MSRKWTRADCDLQSQFDGNFLDWNANLLRDRGPNIHALSLRFDTDHQRVSGADLAAVTMGLIFPPS